MRRSTTVLLAFGLTACSAVNDPGRHMGSPPPPSDAGGGLDGSPGDDGGGTTDAGGPRDGGGMTDTGTDAGPGPIEPIDLCDELVAIACEAKLRCCMPTPTETLTECRIALEPGCSGALEALAVDARTGYDPAIAREAIEEGRTLAATCDPAILDWFTNRDGLMRMFRGVAPEDASCELADVGSFYSCDYPLICLPRFLGRTCQHPTAETSNCWEDIGCDTGLFCNRPTLAAGTCEVRHGDTEDCTRNLQCQSLVCRGPDGMATCQPRTANVYCDISAGG